MDHRPCVALLVVALGIFDASSSSLVLRAQSSAPQLTIEAPSPVWRQTVHGRGLPASSMCEVFIGGTRLGLGNIGIQFSGRFTYSFETGMFPNVFPRPVSLTCGELTFTGVQETETGTVPLSPAGFLTFDAPIGTWQTVVRGTSLPVSCGMFSLTSIAGNVPMHLGLGATDGSGAFAAIFNVPPEAQAAESFEWVAQPGCGDVVFQGANPGGSYPRSVLLTAVETPPGPQLVVERPETRSSQAISAQGLPANASCDLTLGGIDAGYAFVSSTGTFDSTFTTTNVPNAFPRSVSLGCGALTFTGVQVSATGTVALNPAGSLNFHTIFTNTIATVRGRHFPPSCASFALNAANGGLSHPLGGTSTNAVGEFTLLSNFPPAAENAERYQWAGQGACAASTAYQGLNPRGPYPRVVHFSSFKPAPVITWVKPAPMLSGTALSSAQLNARAEIPGTFVYSPPAGTALPIGTGHVLSVTFTPSDTSRYDVATKIVEIDVLPPSAGGRFAGRISDAFTGNALPNVTVVALTTSGVPVAAAISDQSGQYVMLALSPGLYVAKATGATGFLDEVYRELSCVVDCNAFPGTRISVVSGQTAGAIDFSLTPASSASTLMWTRKTPPHSPPPRSTHAMAYDAARRQVVLFGGGGNGFLNYGDTWVWDGHNWSEKFPVSSPPPLYYATMAYDASRGEVVLFGGGTPAGSNQTWVWDGSNWARKNPVNSPPPLIEHAMVYDAARGEVVLFGGVAIGTGYSGDTWIWDGTDWSQRDTTHRPTARVLHAMAYDEAREQVVLFGGHDGATRNDTWIWDGVDWTEVSPRNGPPPTTQHAMVYDAEQREVILFGGGDIMTLTTRSDTWAWDGASWTKKNPARRPQARTSHGIAYDAEHRQVVLFGGCCESFGPLFDDTWVWDAFSAIKTTPTIHWAQPSSILAGTPLGHAQLNAWSSVPGTFQYAPPLGSVLSPGQGQLLSVTFTPSDTATYSVVTTTVTIDVVAPPPAVVTVHAGTFVYDGSPHMATATATGVDGAAVPGTFKFTYEPGGSAPPVDGGSYRVTAAFTSSDPAYGDATGSGTITILPATPTLTWPTPSAIAEGTALGATQLNATVNALGTLIYTPPAGTLLNAGDHALTVHFTPANPANYTVATQTVILTVTPTPGQLQGEGRIDDGDLQHRFAFQVSEQASGGERGWLQLDVNRSAPRGRTTVGRFRSVLLEQVVFWHDPAGRPGLNAALFSGLGAWNNESGYTFTAEASDRGEPGPNRDQVRFTIRNPQGGIVVTFTGVVDIGNIRFSRDH